MYLKPCSQLILKYLGYHEVADYPTLISKLQISPDTAQRHMKCLIALKLVDLSYEQLDRGGRRSIFTITNNGKREAGKSI